MKYLIVGINSNIVNEIKNKLKDYDFISHKDLDKTNLAVYRKIIIFSWSKLSIEANIKIVNSIEKSKLIFISTTAVLSLNRRKQWNNYPNWKKTIESIVLNRNGKIIRIGVWDKNFKKKIYGSFPFTSKSKLVNTLNSIEKIEDITNCFEISKGKLGKLQTIFAKFINCLCLFFPSIFIFQAPLEGIIKILGIKSYGYTNDSNFFFQESIMIGSGCLGSEYQKYKTVDKVLVSHKKDKYLNNNGFKDTILGTQHNGLAKYWHGVHTRFNKNGKIVKKVPLLVDRGKIFLNKYEIHVEHINDVNNYFEIKGKSKENIQQSFFSKKIVLAAGPFTNSYLLKDYAKQEIYFDDHESINIGTIDLEEAIEKKFLVQKGFLILNQKLDEISSGKYRMLMETKPYNSLKLRKNLYADTTRNIIFKLLKRFNFESINEAFFNKFGFGFRTKKIFISMQILVPNAIKFSNKTFYRKRLTKKDFEDISDVLSSKFNSFSAENFESFDGQHTMGGSDFFKNKKLLNLVSSKRIKILGSPTVEKLDIFHHTEVLKKEIGTEKN